jgi:hypothetical protein
MADAFKKSRQADQKKAGKRRGTGCDAPVLRHLWYNAIAYVLAVL